jgi:hypothetical protein
MEISSVASQALAVKEQMTQSQMGIAAIRQVSDAQEKSAEMLARNGKVVPPSSESRQGGFSTYA